MRGLWVEDVVVRRTLLSLVIALGVALGAATPADAAPPSRSIEALIEVATVRTPVGVATAPARCAWIQRGEASQGELGYVIRLTAAEGDGRHRFDLAPDRYGAELHVTFYESLGTCHDGGRGARSFGMNDAVRGATTGIVPAGARYALVVNVVTVTAVVGICYWLFVVCPPGVWGTATDQPFRLRLEATPG